MNENGTPQIVVSKKNRPQPYYSHNLHSDQNRPAEATNNKPEYSLDDISQIHCNKVTQYQQSTTTREAGDIDTERKQELRRQLVRNKL
jgi:hypothetical protein